MFYATRRNLNYNEGDIIAYNASGGLRRLVLVEEKDDDIKNGRPGFSGVEVDPKTMKPYFHDSLGGGVWGYDDQITRVVKRN
jgi:hypothetical protein